MIVTTKTNSDNVEQGVEKDVEKKIETINVLWDLEILFIVFLLLCCVSAVTCCCILFIKKDSKQKIKLLQQMEAVPKRLSSESQELSQNDACANIQIVEGGSCRFYVRAITDWEPSEEDQLNLTNDQIFCIVYTTESGWWYGIDKEGNDGWLPSNYVNKMSTNEVEELKRPSSFDDDEDVCIDLLTPQMDESYNNIQSNPYKFDNLPPTIPPVKLTMITAGDDSSSSSSDDDQTLGSLNTSF